MRRFEKDKKAATDDCWTRACEVSEPKKHPQDFTIYTVVLKMIPRSTTEDEYQILVYKRYRQFRRLHKVLSSYHEKLHRPDKFPPFTKPTMFGRFDAEVVEERRQSAEIYLNFICQHRHLYTHNDFVLFFEGGIRSNPKSALRNPVEPFDFSTFTGPQSASACSDTASSDQRPSFSDDPENFALPTTPLDEENVVVDPLPPLVTGDSDSLDGQIDRIVDAALTSPLPESDLSFFDPCSAVDREVPIDSASREDQGQTNFWLLSAMDACSEPDVGVARRTAAIVPDNTEAFEAFNQEQRPKSGVKNFFVNLKEKARPGGKKDIAEGSNVNESYVYSAASLIKHAQQLEINGLYEAAFNAYKNGVGILLAGVQTDSDPARREVVRQRTGQYLVHAEALYNQYLSGSDEPGNANASRQSSNQTSESFVGEQRWQISDSSVMLSLDPTLSRLHFSVAELRSYKVLGILHERVLLVMDLSANQTCVIKSIRKCSVMDPEIQSCVPINIPYMVRLHKIIETEDTIYLVLEYATGGRLYDFVKEYLTNFHGFDEVDRPVIHRGDLPENENVYTGKVFPQVGDANGQNDNVSLGTLGTQSKISTDSDHSDDRKGEDDLKHAPGYINMFSQCIADFEQHQQVDVIDAMHDDQKSVSSDVESAMKQSEETRSFQRVLNGATSDVVTNNFSIESNSSGEPENLDEIDEGRGSVESEPENPDAIDEERGSVDNELEKSVETLLDEKKELVIDSADEGRVASSECLEGETEVSKSRSSSRSRSTSAGRQYTRQRSHSIGGTHEGGARSRAWSSVFAQLDAEQSKETALQLPESCIKQWAAEIVTALLSLHRRGIIVGDLHPGNILLGRGGHVLLTYISRWKQAPQKPCRESLEGGYAAPEVMTLEGPQVSSDWFSLGVILYELLTGKTFIAAFPGGISSHSVIQLPSHVSTESQDLVHNLLTYHSNQRLGSGNVTSDIKLHPFFKEIDWKKIRHQG